MVSAAHRNALRAWRKWSRVTDVLSDTIPGIKVVKAFNQEAREIDRFDERNESVTDEFNRIHQMWTTFWPLLMLAVHTMTVSVWFFALPRLLGTGAPLSAGVFVSFLLYTTMFVAPIEVIGQMARTMNRAVPGPIAVRTGHCPGNFTQSFHETRARTSIHVSPTSISKSTRTCSTPHRTTSSRWARSSTRCPL